MKPVRKVVNGGRAARLLPFAEKKLRELNARDPQGVLKKAMQVGDAQILIKQGPAGDTIHIRAGLTFVASIVTQEGSQLVAVLFNSSTTTRPWRKASALAPTTGYFGTIVQAAKGVGILEQRAGTLSTFSRTSDYGRSFKPFMTLVDGHSGGHAGRTFIKGGHRGMWLTMSAAVIRVMEASDVVSLVYPIDTIQQPNFCLESPDSVFMYAGPGVASGGAFVPAAFQVTRNAGASIGTITNNTFLDGVNLASGSTHPRANSGFFAASNTTMDTISHDVALFCAVVPGRNPNSDETAYAAWRVNFATGDATATLDLGDLPLVAVMGKGVIVLIEPNKVFRTTPRHQETIRHLSMDNGLTWTSSPAALPLAPSGVRGDFADYNPVRVIKPYVDSDNKGEIYMIASITGTTQGDVVLWKSTDLGLSWTKASTIEKADALPATSGTPHLVAIANLFAVGLSIDPILPWTRDDSAVAPEWWTH